jgi:hypothetical protein
MSFQPSQKGNPFHSEFFHPSSVGLHPNERDSSGRGAKAKSRDKLDVNPLDIIYWIVCHGLYLCRRENAICTPTESSNSAIKTRRRDDDADDDNPESTLKQTKLEECIHARVKCIEDENEQGV